MPNTLIEERLEKLEVHLKKENDFLVDVLPTFRHLDKIAYRLGILDAEAHSYITRISWWPIISILGTFSSGKSTFINHYLGQNLQRTGSQAVDDKFTVVCYGGEKSDQTTLPGIALDADDRFPFYEISHNIAQLNPSQDHRVDAYLQMKTCSSESLRGKILIDSPGFDADDQRTSVLHNIAQHIIDLSDLVLIFFDARHAEPGAMRDTLTYLVKSTLTRADSNKFLYILNQIDITAREDNLEEVVAAWQRSLAQTGLTAGRFHRIYNPQVATPIEDPQVKERFEKKCDIDTKEIYDRMNQVGIDRAYRLTGMLEHTAKEIEETIVPKLEELIHRWKKRVFWVEAMGIIGVGGIIALWFAMTGTWSSVLAQLQSLEPSKGLALGGIALLILLFLHLKITKKSAKSLVKKVIAKKEINDDYVREGVLRAFRKNACFLRSLFIYFIANPKGWNTKTRKRLYAVLGDINNYVQTLNDRFTNPSGKKDIPREDVKAES